MLQYSEIDIFSSGQYELNFCVPQLKKSVKMFQIDAHKLKREFDKRKSKYRDPEAAKDQIIRKIIDERARSCGILGFMTSFGGFVTMLIALPIDIFLSMNIESEMIYLLAYAYGYSPDNLMLESLKNYVLSETVPEGEALKIGVKLGAVTAEEVLRRKRNEAVREVGKEGIKEVGQTIFTNATKLARKTSGKTARKVLFKVFIRSIGKLIAKVIPIVGAIIGYRINSQSAQRTGNLALYWLNQLEVERQNNTDDII